MDKIHSINSDVPLISVVAPVYKVEPFLQECIDSVLNQSFKDFELILVDDGSPDKCGEICDRAAKKDSHIRVFHQVNGGVSSARRIGVENAKGTWIYMIDPDDRLPSNAIQDLISAPEKFGYNIEDFDIVEGANRRFQQIGNKNREKTLPSFGFCEYQNDSGAVVGSAIDYAKSVIYPDKKKLFKGVVWEKIIRRSLLIETDALNVSKEYFQAQDFLFSLKLSKKIRKVLRIPNIVYEYRCNPNSTTRTKSKMKVSWGFEYTSSLLSAAKEILEEMGDDWLEKVYKPAVARIFANRIVASHCKTWRLRSVEFKPYLAIMNEEKDVLTGMAKVCLLVTRFPFTLVPERVFFFCLFGAKAILVLPKRILEKLRFILAKN